MANNTPMHLIYFSHNENDVDDAREPGTFSTSFVEEFDRETDTSQQGMI